MKLKDDFSDGDVLYSKTTSDPDGLNGITNEVNRKGVIHRKVYESAAQETVTGNTSFNDTSKTFTITAPIGSLIIGINIMATIRTIVSDNSTATANLKINGTNLGTYYCISGGIYLVSGASTPTPSFAITTDNSYLFLNNNDVYLVFSANINKPLKLLDTTTTFTIQLRTSSSSYTAYIKDVAIEVIYVENVEEDA
ncbi:MAG: hypothetical protein PHO87_04570 [Acholeplasmataceae bacterium]|nr:hypothetical protein [Acholeplasmataceae bacterium]